MPALALVMGMPVRVAMGLPLVAISASSSAALLGYLGHVNIDYRIAFIVTTAASVGALIGSQLVARIKTEVLRRSFSILVLGCVVVARTSPISNLSS